MAPGGANSVCQELTSLRKENDRVVSPKSVLYLNIMLALNSETSLPFIDIIVIM